MSDQKYLRIQIHGYGGESAYINLTKEAYDFWEQLASDEDTLRDYMLDEDGDGDLVVPDNAAFLTNYGDNEDKSPWFDAPSAFEHSFGADLEQARITITEADGDDYDANTLHELVDDEELDEYLSSFQEDDDPVDLLFRGDIDAQAGDYIVQFLSSEKGMFFDGFIPLDGEFDPKKLKVTACEYPNGEDTVTNVEYDGEEVDNTCGDTNGKGYSVDIWIP